MDLRHCTNLPTRRILLVSTVGGSTNAAPLLEIGKVLHARGHKIDFATLEGGQKLTRRYAFIEQVHILGRGFTAEEDEEVYSRASRYTANTMAGRGEICFLKTFLDGFWVENYPALKHVISEHKYDFLFSDYQNDACKDMMIEHNIPLAQLWPQSPLLMAPHPWIPGDPFLQQKCLTSEHASVYDRLFEMTSLLRSLPWLAYALLWGINMRRKAGVTRLIRLRRKPDHLVFVNSFFGLEPPKDVPPLMNYIGPILSSEYAPLDKVTEQFLEKHPKTAFVALGTHVRLSQSQFERLVVGLRASIASRHLDGVVWAIQAVTRRQIDTVKAVRGEESTKLTYGDLLNNKDPNFLMVDFAPQRAVLSCPNTALFFTHCGASSANEGAYHGVPMLALPFYSDQIPGALRLCDAGVALRLDKFTFTSEEVQSKVARILADEDGAFARNCLRLQRIARVAARGKEVAADMIEQHMYDHELRFDAESRQQLRPMHLQTADSRMGILKANNFDLLLVGLALLGGTLLTFAHLKS